MNTLNKLTAGALLGVLALASTASARATEVTLPSLSAVTAEVTKLIATELKVQLSNALKAPRTVRVRKSPSVTISAIEKVTAAAPQMPMETVVVTATRLPIETVVVAATRLPADVARPVRTAQVRL